MHNEGVCQCRTGYVYAEARSKCFPASSKLATTTRRPPHIRIETRDRKAEEGRQENSIVVLEKNLEDLYQRAKEEKR